MHGFAVALVQEEVSLVKDKLILSSVKKKLKKYCRSLVERVTEYKQEHIEQFSRLIINSPTKMQLRRKKSSILSIRVSPGLNLARHISPSFGSPTFMHCVLPTNANYGFFWFRLNLQSEISI